DRVRALPARQLRLGDRRPRARPRVRADLDQPRHRRRRRPAFVERYLRPAADARQRRRADEADGAVPARHPARLPERSGPRRLPPWLADRRRGRDQAVAAVRDRPLSRDRPGEPEGPRIVVVSEARGPYELDEVTIEDVRKLMGASTPHFALQLRNRIARLIAPLEAGHPARVL